MTHRHLVVFDVDGTLVDSQAEILAAMMRAFAAEALAMPSRSAVLAIVGLSLPQAFARLAPDRTAAVQARLCAHYRDAFRVSAATGQAHSPLFAGVEVALRRLQARGDTLLAVATGKSRRGLDRLIAQHGWHDLFISCQTADDHPSKPHPAMLMAALRDAGVAPGQAVMVGDTTYDMDMARAAGVTAIGVSWGYHAPDMLAADHVITDFSALDAVLDDQRGEVA